MLGEQSIVQGQRRGKPLAETVGVGDLPAQPTLDRTARGMRGHPAIEYLRERNELLPGALEGLGGAVDLDEARHLGLGRGENRPEDRRHVARSRRDEALDLAAGVGGATHGLSGADPGPQHVGHHPRRQPRIALQTVERLQGRLRVAQLDERLGGHDPQAGRVLPQDRRPDAVPGLRRVAVDQRPHSLDRRQDLPAQPPLLAGIFVRPRPAPQGLDLHVPRVEPVPRVGGNLVEHLDRPLESPFVEGQATSGESPPIDRCQVGIAVEQQVEPFFERPAHRRVVGPAATEVGGDRHPQLDRALRLPVGGVPSGQLGEAAGGRQRLLVRVVSLCETEEHRRRFVLVEVVPGEHLAKELDGLRPGPLVLGEVLRPRYAHQRRQLLERRVGVGGAGELHQDDGPDLFVGQAQIGFEEVGVGRVGLDHQPVAAGGRGREGQPAAKKKPLVGDEHHEEHVRFDPPQRIERREDGPGIRSRGPVEDPVEAGGEGVGGAARRVAGHLLEQPRRRLRLAEPSKGQPAVEPGLGGKGTLEHRRGIGQGLQDLGGEPEAGFGVIAHDLGPQERADAAKEGDPPVALRAGQTAALHLKGDVVGVPGRRFEPEDGPLDLPLGVGGEGVHLPGHALGPLSLRARGQTEERGEARRIDGQQLKEQVRRLIGEPDRPPKVVPMRLDQLAAQAQDALEGREALLGRDARRPDLHALGGHLVTHRDRRVGGGVGGEVVIEHLRKLQLDQPLDELLLVEPLLERLGPGRGGREQDRESGDDPAPAGTGRLFRAGGRQRRAHDLSRLCKGDVGVMGSRQGVEGVDDVLPARGPSGHDHHRMIRLEEPPDRMLGDLPLAEELEELLEVRRLAIGTLDPQRVRAAGVAGGGHLDAERLLVELERVAQLRGGLPRRQVEPVDLLAELELGGHHEVDEQQEHHVDHGRQVERHPGAAAAAAPGSPRRDRRRQPGRCVAGRVAARLGCRSRGGHRHSSVITTRLTRGTTAATSTRAAALDTAARTGSIHS